MSWFTMLGALIGAVAGTFAGIAFVGWYNTPGSDRALQAAMCPCAENAREAAAQLIQWQAGCAVLGLVVLNFIGHSIRRRWAARAAAKATPVV